MIGIYRLERAIPPHLAVEMSRYAVAWHSPTPPRTTLRARANGAAARRHMTVLVVGAGWSGAVVARSLHDMGIDVHVLEAAQVVGGHARCEVLNGVVYEPNGAHIFHTSNPAVAAFVQRFGMVRPYEHRVLTEVYVRDDDEHPRLFAWPPQVDQLRELPDWPLIERELDARPAQPTGEDFESWVISLMGERLYRLFIEGYTRKQWGCDPSELSSRFAPRRVDLRTNGETRLFNDTWEFFPEQGCGSIIEAILAPVPVTCGVEAHVDDVDGYFDDLDAVVITAPLDDFGREPEPLAWRGIHMVSSYYPVAEASGTRTPAYVVNRPSLRVPYTRTVETKHATGQRIAATVVSEEVPGAPARHYPVPTVDGRHERRNAELQDAIRERLAPLPTFFCGRLSTYTYIDQDQAIERAFSCAEEVAAACAKVR